MESTRDRDVRIKMLEQGFVIEQINDIHNNIGLNYIQIKSMGNYFGEIRCIGDGFKKAK